jgi:hypothetical protein
MTIPGFAAEASLREGNAPQTLFRARSAVVSRSAEYRSRGSSPHAITPQQSLDDGGVYTDPTLTRYCHRICWPGGFCEIVCRNMYY